MDKETIISGIKQRILDEQRKHQNLDWAEIAARKIYSTYISCSEIDMSEAATRQLANSIYFRCRRCGNKGAKYEQGLCPTCELYFK